MMEREAKYISQLYNKHGAEELLKVSYSEDRKPKERAKETQKQLESNVRKSSWGICKRYILKMKAWIIPRENFKRFCIN
jgi:hypothetical protein